MDISLSVQNSSWETVYNIVAKTKLLKGRHGLYHEIVQAAGLIQSRFGCYAWGANDNLYYIGSFSKDYKRGGHKSNLHARVHNYLQNHRIKKSGKTNTNLMVFENLNRLLLISDVSLFIYRFDFLVIGEDKVEYIKYCNDGELVRAVEQLLISSYRRNQQCKWNRG